MKLKNIVLIGAIFSYFTIFSQQRQLMTIGPMIHFNIQKGGFHTSYGIETAYWNYVNVPYSIDFGVEFGGNKMRVYSELQTGIAVAGFAIGGVYQFDFKDKSESGFGLQHSFWINYIAGFDMRFRRIHGKKEYCPGLYVKVPFGFGYYEHYGDESHSSFSFDD